MTSHRIKDRRKPVQSGVLACVFGIAVTSQNNSLGGLPLIDDLSAGEHRVLSGINSEKRPFSSAWVGPVASGTAASIASVLLSSPTAFREIVSDIWLSVVWALCRETGG